MSATSRLIYDIPGDDYTRDFDTSTTAEDILPATVGKWWLEAAEMLKSCTRVARPPWANRKAEQLGSIVWMALCTTRHPDGRKWTTYFAMCAQASEI
jgi:hypothetical protein